ncbi:SGNH/GDSL hydrolase family protein [Antrihabitans cavernicola]|uniref:SGNH/GDSL hydrolase family protein n=1 Tax=Antrihabitans cavernicola TaxID=2495913 RepID=UPI001659A41C|nr:SGNH/GDSL hydrolase family protein [Spelaeibacter cavernicola]
MRARSIGALVLAAAAAGGFGTQASAAPAYSEYVALGDSWSADVSVLNATTRFTPIACAQSNANYPKQVAAALGVAVFRDATCGGATTADMTSPQQISQVGGLLAGVNPAQFDRLTPTTDLVTVGIGGNDVGLADAIMGCTSNVDVGTPCKDRFFKGGVDTISVKTRETEAKIVDVIAGIRARSPKAKIELVGYLDGVPTQRGCFATIPITDGDITWIGQKLVELDGVMRSAAATAGANYVDTYSTSIGHDACQAPGVRWVEGLVPFSSDPPGPAVPFHPNQLGADHQARAVLTALGR